MKLVTLAQWHAVCKTCGFEAILRPTQARWSWRCGGSGYVWEWVFTVDFGYCIGRVAKTQKATFEFRIVSLSGASVSLVGLDTPVVKSGSVAGTAVRWHSTSDHVHRETFEYETFALIDKTNQRYLSLQVYADSESQILGRLKVLERLKYR